MLAGVLQGIDDCDTVVSRPIELARIKTARVRQRGPQRRGAARVGADEFGVPVVFLAVGEFAQIQKVAVRIVVDAHVAEPETRDVVADIGCTVNRREGVARGGLHHLHARAVVGPPIGVIGHFLGIGAGAAVAVGAGGRLGAAARVGVTGDGGGNRAAQDVAWYGAGAERSRRQCHGSRVSFGHRWRIADGTGRGDGHDAAGSGSGVTDDLAIARLRQCARVDLGGDVAGHRAGGG